MKWVTVSYSVLSQDTPLSNVISLSSLSSLTFLCASLPLGHGETCRFGGNFTIVAHRGDLQADSEKPSRCFQHVGVCKSREVTACPQHDVG